MADADQDGSVGQNTSEFYGLEPRDISSLSSFIPYDQNHGTEGVSSIEFNMDTNMDTNMNTNMDTNMDYKMQFSMGFNMDYLTDLGLSSHGPYI